MIDIKFGKYSIKTADERNIIITETVLVTKEGSKNFGKEVEKVLGYYSNIGSALKAYINKDLADEEVHIETAKCLLEEFESLNNKVEEAVQCIRM